MICKSSSEQFQCIVLLSVVYYKENKCIKHKKHHPKRTSARKSPLAMKTSVTTKTPQIEVPSALEGGGHLSRVHIRPRL